MKRALVFSQLGSLVYGALVDATSLATARKHGFVELDHWFYTLMQREQSDVVQLLRLLDCDTADVLVRLKNALSRLRETGENVRDISPLIEQTVSPAIVWNQLAGHSQKVRSGHLFLAWFEMDITKRWLNQLTNGLVDRYSVDEVYDLYSQNAKDWDEHGLSEPIESSKDFSFKLDGDKSLVSDSSDTKAVLGKWATCLTDLAKGQLDPVIGREFELRAAIDILMRRRQNNPMLVGEAGVGKTAVVEALAQKISSGLVPDYLKDAAVWSLDITRLQAGAGAKGEFEQRLKSVLDAIAASEHPIILFCDEAHTLIGAGGTTGTGDAANMIKPMLARGQLRMIAATTWSEYKQYIETDAALVRRFQPIEVKEPDDVKALNMLRAIAPKYAAHHKVRVEDRAIKAAVQLSRRYLPARQLPDKAISLLDTACARVAMMQSIEPADLNQLREQLFSLEQEISWLKNDQQLGINGLSFDELSIQRTALIERINIVSTEVEQERLFNQTLMEGLSSHEDSTDGLIPQIENEEYLNDKAIDKKAVFKSHSEQSRRILPWVTKELIETILSEWTGIPVQTMHSDEIERIAKLESHLIQKIYGQDDAVAIISKSLKVSMSGLKEPNRPLGVFMLCGQTGTGKSKTAEILAEELFGHRQNLIHFNMNEFQEAHTISTLKGAPPGYVGYGKGGRLTESVRRKPYCVLLLDEFDRAHVDIQEMFYQVFDQGWMEDGEGRKIDFSNSLIILTSNIGDEAIQAACLSAPDITQSALVNLVRDPMTRKLSPALLARMQLLCYRPLSQQALASIAKKMLQDVQQRAEEVSASIEIADEVSDWIGQLLQNHPSSGRAVGDFVRHEILPALSDLMLSGKADTECGEDKNSIFIQIIDNRLCMDYIGAVSSEIIEQSALLGTEIEEELCV